MGISKMSPARDSVALSQIGVDFMSEFCGIPALLQCCSGPEYCCVFENKPVTGLTTRLEDQFAKPSANFDTATEPRATGWSAPEIH
jgi:hypothetical protein